ncbi:MAG: hypothetical protein GEU74_15350 [Nitriliruptorales bacterium]|nr:hypothetical protein [Nitriliruptorales bacterium]
MTQQRPSRTAHLDQLQLGAIASVGLSLALWIRAKTLDQAQRAHAEHRAMFVGLWPPTLWLVSDALAGRRSRTGSRT